jgi:hypothetical protein
MTIEPVKIAVQTCPKCGCDMDEYSIDGVRFRLCCNCEYKIILSKVEG